MIDICVVEIYPFYSLIETIIPAIHIFHYRDMYFISKINQSKVANRGTFEVQVKVRFSVDETAHNFWGKFHYCCEHQ